MIPIRARGRTHVQGVMNKLEGDYAEYLGFLRLAGEINTFMYERIKLKLADRTWYTPDFMVILSDGTVEFHEVKGFMRDDAAVKLKVAADKFPQFAFFLVKKDSKEGWSIKAVPPKA